MAVAATATTASATTARNAAGGPDRRPGKGPGGRAVMGEPDAALDMLLTRVDELQRFNEMRAALEPPAELADLHQRQLAIAESWVGVIEELGRIRESGEVPNHALADQLGALASEMPSLAAEWAGVTATVLAGMTAG